MTMDDEERIMLEAVLSARHAVKLEKEAKREHEQRIKEAERNEYVAEQAFIDYMKAHGIKATEVAYKWNVTLGQSTAIDVPDVDALPAQYVREKIIREPNKALIAEMHKAGALTGANWYSVRVSDKITITNK